MNRPRTGFTILELMLALGLIMLLIGVVIASMRGVRSAANRTDSLNSLRNMVRGYSTYSTDNRQRLMPGYLDEPQLSDPGMQGISAKLPSGFDLMNDLTCDTDGRCDASSYVWRLSPYLDNSWQTMFTDYRSQALRSELVAEYGTGSGAGGEGYGPATANPSAGELGIGTIPSFGLNSVFVGGDSYHGNSALVDRNPFNPADPNDVIAATAVSQVLNPSRLTLFGATMMRDDDDAPADLIPTGVPSTVNNLVFGYVELRPPYTEIDPDTGQGFDPSRQWLINPDGVIEPTGNFGDKVGGWPVGRWGEDDIPIGKFDGSVEVADRWELGRDMTRWSPFATGLR